MHLLLPSFLSSFVMLPAGRKEVIMGKHLTLDDRMSMQCFLKERMPTSAIAKRLCKAQSTIVREILKHRIFIDRHNVSTMQTKNACTNCDLQLFFYRSDNTARSVTNIFNWFRTALSDEEYEKLFPVILTDRGSEFTDPVPIEVDLSTGVIQTKVFYCDPMNSNQKSKCERNHELFRYIIPKGNSFTVLNPQKTELIMNNVNSYPRKRLGGKSPIAVFKSIYGEAITEKLGLKELSPKDVSLKPSLIQ